MKTARKHQTSADVETSPALKGPWAAGEADAAQSSPARALQASLQDALAVREGPRFSGPVRLTLVVGGALASWAVVLGSAGMILAR